MAEAVARTAAAWARGSKRWSGPAKLTAASGTRPYIARHQVRAERFEGSHRAEG